MPKQKSRRRSNSQSAQLEAVDHMRDAGANIAAVAWLMADCNPTASVDGEAIICLGAMLVAETERLQTALETIKGERS